MDWMVFCCIFFLNIFPLDGAPRHGWNVNQLLELLKRRNFMDRHNTILRVPRYPEDLPAAEPILPGHTLLRPSNSMLRSAIKFPLRDINGAAVYGNLDNLGMTYGKSRQRVLYTNFRKANLKTSLQSLIEKLRSNKPGSLIVIEIDPNKLKAKKYEKSQKQPNTIKEQVIDEDNNGSEVLDNLDELLENSDEVADFRRKKSKQKSNSKYRNRDKYYKKKDPDSADFDMYSKKERKERNRSKSKEELTSLEEHWGKTSDESSSSSSIEKNPGNPFTIHKNKYKQNWLWNHFMDGDHMNINPLAPSLSGHGVNGADLFFGRKWWYFNQDDYKPLR